MVVQESGQARSRTGNVVMTFNDLGDDDSLNGPVTSITTWPGHVLLVVVMTAWR